MCLTSVSFPRTPPSIADFAMGTFPTNYQVIWTANGGFSTHSFFLSFFKLKSSLSYVYDDHWASRYYCNQSGFILFCVKLRRESIFVSTGVFWINQCSSPDDKFKLQQNVLVVIMLSVTTCYLPIWLETTGGKVVNYPYGSSSNSCRWNMNTLVTIGS
jgi:hypothetical protein